MSRSARLRNYLLTGLVTVLPIWLTWLVFDFVFRQLSSFGMPWAQQTLAAVNRLLPGTANLIEVNWLMQLVGAIVTLALLIGLGWAAQKVIGRRLIETFHLLMTRIPIIETIYGAVRKLITVLQQKPEGGQRVVLIAFPSADMKTIGFLTRTLTCSRSGRVLAVVYVPTTPNPTSGYLEIVPIERITRTDWTLDQAMSFVMSGGAIAPESIDYGDDPADRPTP